MLGSRPGEAAESQGRHPPVVFKSYGEGEREALRISFPGDDFTLELSQPDADTGQGD